MTDPPDFSSASSADGEKTPMQTLPPTTSKGKGLMDQLDPSANHPAPPASAMAEDEEESCGICLAVGGRIPGHIDSCNHFFCFVCILEWAKIESLCPLCRQRFHSIRRPRVDGLFRDERVVQVPVRDQVYDPRGTQSTRISETYSRVSCSVCNLYDNEELLLLCELCDSGAHTYCVGLGFTLPEGDWYCPDCVTSRTEHSKLLDSDNSDQVPRESDNVSLFNGQRAVTANSDSDEDEFDSPSRAVAHMLTLSSGLSEDAPLPLISSSRSYNSVRDRSARTLRNRQMVQYRISLIRQNWNALRMGSMDFSSITQSSTLKVASVTPGSTQESNDIKKAWKMMEKSKRDQNYPTKKKCHDSLNHPCSTNFLLRPKEVYSGKSCIGNANAGNRMEGKKRLPIQVGNPSMIISNLPSNKRFCHPNDHCSSTCKSDSLASKNGGTADAPKSEIQSLVKQNLSLIHRDRRLGTEIYKQVARICTHTILAACGLEHSSSIARSFTRPICNHTEQIKQLRRSNLMPNSCKECFYTFVRDIVNSVVSEEKFQSRP